MCENLRTDLIALALELGEVGSLEFVLLLVTGSWLVAALVTGP
jgi:hypothetical protein